VCVASTARSMSTTANVGSEKQRRYEFVVLTGQCSSSLISDLGSKGRDSVVRPPNGGVNSPTQQDVCVGGWRVAQGCFVSAGGALEGLAGPCEAGARTGGRQEQGNRQRKGSATPSASGGETPKLMGRQYRWKNITCGDLPLQKTIFCFATLRSRLLMHGSAVRGLRLIDTSRRSARDLSFYMAETALPERFVHRQAR